MVTVQAGLCACRIDRTEEQRMKESEQTSDTWDRKATEPLLYIVMYLSGDKQL